MPGEQPQEGGFIKLNTNENPYPPSPRVKDALAEAIGDRLRLYPDPMATEFRRTAAQLHGVEPDMVLAGNGSDDLLTIMTRAFVGPGDPAGFPSPSYLLYSTLIALQDGRPVVVPYTRDWTLEKSALAVPGLKLFFLANPDSPSGTALTREQVAELAGRSTARWSSTRPMPISPTRATTHAPARGSSQRDRHAVVQQGVQPGGDPARATWSRGPRSSSTWSRSRIRTTATS